MAKHADSTDDRVLNNPTSKFRTFGDLRKYNKEHSRRRKPLALRPWLRNFVYDMLTQPSYIHADLYAYSTYSGGLYFRMIYSAGGKKIIAEDWLTVEGEYFKECEAPRKAMHAVYWDRNTHYIFKRCHRALVERAEALGILLPGAARVSVHCHYVTVLNLNPFPSDAIVTQRTRDAVKPGILPDWL